ncbi:hypothetical protein V1264_011253 [Littorina saxatilis]|uniref:Uncharacterized protein n=1 Tax=Littorina saxatilis TaxID=31220 RepID=A0AAN9BTR9_9CAEN
MDDPLKTCPICNEPCDVEVNTLGKKGCARIKDSSQRRQNRTVQPTVGQRVHIECRRDYTNDNNIEKDLRQQNRDTDKTELGERSTRSKQHRFDFASCCFFCGTRVNLSKTRGPDEAYRVRTLSLQTEILKKCDERNDEWADIVKGKLEFARDLHAADAVYHITCNCNFRAFGLSIPKRYNDKPGAYALTNAPSRSVGRPPDTEKLEVFEKTAEYLINHDDEQITIGELVQKMQEFSGGVGYTTKWMKEKLLERFGENIIIANILGKSNVVTFRTTAKSILHDFYNSPKTNDDESEKLKLVKAAAALIKNEIKAASATTNKEYPTSEDISSGAYNLDFVPQSLQLFLRLIFSEKDADNKIASVGQAIVQAARPRVVIAPLQIGLGVQMHHHFGSRYLIDVLNAMGFSSSYTEVQRFEANAAVSQSTDIPGCAKNVILQYVADNVDHNSCTLDGYNSFHGMGMIATTTPGTRRTTPIPRLDVTSKDSKEKGTIDIVYFQSKAVHFGNTTYRELENLRAVDPSIHLDVLWKVVWPLKPARPSWSGTMQAVHNDRHPGKSSVFFLPMIDMNPGDLTCIHSTLLFTAKEAKRHGSTPVLTFDQPLFWKAHEIVANKPDDADLASIVLRLEGFHMEMSFLGCIGRLMEGSGLQEVLELTYAPTAVNYMLQGKAVSRAVRGHFLVDSALNALLTSQTFKISLPLPDLDVTLSDVSIEEIDSTDVPEDVQIAGTVDDIAPSANEDAPVSCEEPDGDLARAANMWDLLMSGAIPLGEVCVDETIASIQLKLERQKQTLKCHPTAALWIQYMDMVDILRKFLKAERTGNWDLHLSTAHEMMPFMAAAGHNLYTKSLHLYLQDMLQLKETHKDVYQSFQAGHHVRRTDRCWAGLSTDR